MKFDFPLYVAWCVTNVCNAHCLHCSSNSGKAFADELTTLEASHLIDELADAGVFSIGFTGGEPLLRHDIYELLDYAISKGVSVGVGTNGLMMNTETAERIRELGIQRVQVSLDGATSSTHDSVRGVKGLYDAALRAIKMLKEKSITVHVCFTPTKLNFKELSEVIDLCAELEVSLFNLSQFVPLGRGPKEIDLTPQELYGVLKIWDSGKRKYAGRMRFVAHESQMILIDPAFANIEGFAGCQAGNGLCCITADGFVEPCVMMDLKVGNVRQQPFKQIWQESSILNKMRNRQLLKGKCGICEHKNKCGGCRAVAYAYTGDFLEEDLRCWHQPQGKM